MNTKKILSLVVLAFAFLATVNTFAQKATTNIVGVAVGSADHSTLVAAVKASGLVETLSSKGPFTVFAPTNEAFSKLPKGTVESLLDPANLKTLQSILTYHVIAGKLDSKSVVEAIKANNGTVTLTTVQGEKLVASLKGTNVIITDEKGGIATVTAVDLEATNGVIHVINSVLMP